MAQRKSEAQGGFSWEEFLSVVTGGLKNNILEKRASFFHPFSYAL